MHFFAQAKENSENKKIQKKKKIIIKFLDMNMII